MIKVEQLEWISNYSTSSETTTIFFKLSLEMSAQGIWVVDSKPSGLFGGTFSSAQVAQQAAQEWFTNSILHYTTEVE